MDKGGEHGTRVVNWLDGPRAIRALAAGARAPVTVIAVCGRVGAGKSSLARALGGLVLSTDDYLPDYDSIAEAERDEPAHADLARLASDLARLRRGEAVRVPVWSFISHRREGEREIRPSDLVVVEGIFALHALVAPAADVRVLVEAPAEDRWSRWARLERTGERGWGVERARAYFDGVAEPTFARYEAAYRRAAQIIVRNEGRAAE